MKIEARGTAGEAVAEDFRSGALRYNDERGGLYKAETDQEYLVINQDRVVRYDGRAQTFSTYFPEAKMFLPEENEQ